MKNLRFFKSLLVLIGVLIVGINQVNAETRRIYCKCAQSWWYADGAACGAYYWGSSSLSAATWPGVKMTETSSGSRVWYIDIDDSYTNVIFTRLNPSDSKYWSAKTGDLTISSSNNYYTISSTSGVWDPSTVSGSWSNKTYSITYKDQGNVAYSGSNSGSLTTSQKWGYALELIEGERDGYVFNGWYTNSSCTGEPITSLGISVNTNQTLYAKWTAETTYTITIANNINATTSTKSIGATPKQITAPTIADYAFSTWSAMPSGVTKTSGNLTDASIYVSATKAATVTANFNLIPVKLWTADEAKFASGSKDHEYTMSYDATEGAYYYQVTTDASPYYFRFWYNGETEYSCAWGSDGLLEVVANGSKQDAATDVTEYGTHTTLKYVGESGTTIKIWFDKQNGKTWITADKDKEYVLRGAFADNDSQADGMPGWGATTSYFEGLASGNTGTISCTLNANEWYHLKAYNVYTKTWWGPSSDTGLSDGTLSSVTSGGSGNFYFQTTVAGSYTFTLDKSSGIKLKVDFPVSYTVNFGVTPAAAADAPTNNLSISSGSLVASGTSITFTKDATPNSGYTWSHWEKNSSNVGSNNTYTTSITANTTVNAVYTEDMHTVTVTTDGHGTITTPASGTPRTVSAGIATGASIAVSANTGYTFYNWTKTSGSGTVTFANVNANSTTVKATSDATVRANFVDTWNIKGDQWSSWDYQPMAATANANEYSKTFTLTKGTKYQFKVVKRTYNSSGDGTTDTWYGNTDDAGNKVFERGESAFTTVADGMNNNLEVTADVTGTYTFTISTSGSTPVITVTYPTAYTVTFGKGTGGGTITASATSAGGSFTSGSYVASGDDVTFAQTASSSGYTFSGWYTTKDTGGSPVTGMGVGDHVLENVTSNKTVWSRYTANNYTVTFDAATNGGSCATESKSVTYDAAYGELPVATHASRTFIGWYTTANDDSETGTRVTAETIVNRTSNHTLYARFESTFEVVVQYKCDGVTLYPGTKVYASATSLAADISAPEILGYQFNNWTGSNATFVNSSSANTKVNASAATTITANYTAKDVVYFKNNLGWEKVYVTFDPTWSSGAPCNNGKPYYEMTQLGSSDIFYCNIPESYTASSYTSWAWNIAFDNHGFSASANVGTFSGGFNTGEFLGRGDFDPKATMFIPYNGDTEACNGGTKYNTGCWMKYNSTDPGYKVYANTFVSGSGSAVGGTPVLLTADVAGGFEFKATVYLPSASYTYGFMLGKENLKNTNDLWYSNGGTITSSTNTLPWHFATKVDGNAVTSTGKRCGLTTEAVGNYEFTVSFGTGRPVVNVTYPVSTGDYRLIYNDRVAWSGSAHDASWFHPSRVIKARANAEDIVSFFVSKADGANASVKIQTCTGITAGNPTWNAGTLVDISSITKTGIYNFKVSQNDSKVATVTVDGGYTGNYYIRTDVSDGGWTNYKTSGTNTMTYSEYSETHGGDFGPYSHYFMRYVNKGQNIKFCIANDYSECISDTVVSDSYTNEWIEAYGNVRFMWYHGTNKIGRAYISGSSNIADRFLVLEGDDKLYNEAGTALTTGQGRVSGLNEYEMNFIDDQNWIYETTVQAKPTERIKLTAKYNNKIQYFYGAEGARSTSTTEQLLGGSGTDKYKIRVVYDFKTNRLIKAFIPENAISTDLEIDADLMIIREHQNDAQQITFNEGGALSKVKTVYGAMKFNKWTINNKSKEVGHESLALSRYERDLFYISFPFDVELRDAFGFGTYGTHWIIEYYDGKGRAEKGFWADSPSNWKFVSPSQRNSGFTLKAFEGYILALDLDEMTESSSVWNNGVENVYVYFPSSAEVKDIDATSRLVPIDQEGYQCTIGPRFAGGDDRRVKDSYWHVIGVPSFANYSRDLHVTNGGTTIDWRNSSMPFLYEWVPASNTLSITSSATYSFKPTFAYMVQYSGASIYWDQVNVTPASVAARYYEDAPQDVEFRLELQQGEQKADQAFVRLSNNDAVTSAFDFNFDLAKEKNKNTANIYTMVTSVINDTASVTETAGNCLPLSNQTTVVPVGVTIKTAGDYTFAIPDGTNGVGVTLVDTENNIRTSLSALSYTVNLSAGTHDGRFLLEIAPIQQTPTDIDLINGENGENGVRKMLIDQQMYIIRDGKIYDARGARVQ